MKTIQRTGVLLLLLVLIFGTTGLSVLHHICSSSNTDNVTIYPEIFRNPASSCCDDESTWSACACPEDPDADMMPGSIVASPCCKSIVSFFKLEILTEKPAKLMLHDDNVRQPLNLPSLKPQSQRDQLLSYTVHFQFFSPPLLFGRFLVHYLHQMKIPAYPPVA